MTRPEIVRADTMDLQDQHQPSAKDHSRQPASIAKVGDGPPAPHQAASLRKASMDGYDMHVRSPRHSQDLSGKELQMLHEVEPEEQDPLEAEQRLTAGAQASGAGAESDGQGQDVDEGDEDDELEDEMNGQISSSPSIDDGGYNPTPTMAWPPREDSLMRVDYIGSTGSVLRPVAPFPSPSVPNAYSLVHGAGSPDVEDVRDDASPVTPDTVIARNGLGFIMERTARRLFLRQKEQGGGGQSEDHHHHHQHPRLSIKGSLERLRGKPSFERLSFKGSVERLRAVYEDVPKSSLSLESFHTAREPSPDLARFREEIDGSYDNDFEEGGLDNLLLNNDDPFVSHSFDRDKEAYSELPESPSKSRACKHPEDIDEYDYDEEDARNDDDNDDDDDDDRDDFTLHTDDNYDEIQNLETRSVDSDDWSGEYLQEVEDIDFEFVYALHTFVATVEGQANATKGDTMVLLDDSNSYWWLVRVVKDSSIGYLPAEHIETPTERLARLNKHRNIDLSQTMLGDNPEKSRNPLKKAMRRRNAKTVQFAEPQYFEPSDREYSSDEEDGDEMRPAQVVAPQAQQGQAQEQAQGQAEAQSQQQQPQGQLDGSAIEPLRTQNGTIAALGPTAPSANTVNGNGQTTSLEQVRSNSIDTTDSQEEEATGRRRQRNTDSFYRDETVETKKISLTPGLLRDDGSGAVATVPAPSEIARASMDSTGSKEKVASPADKGKPEKKKEKKGMLGGLFKRKNSKSKHEKDDETEDWLKSASSRESPQPSDSQSLDSQVSSPISSPAGSQRSSRLQKTPPPQKQGSLTKRGPTAAPQQAAQGAIGGAPAGTIEDSRDRPASNATADDSMKPAPLRQRSASQSQGQPQPLQPQPLQSQPLQSQQYAQQAEVRSTSPQQSHSKGVFGSILGSNAPAESKELKPEKTTKAKTRLVLDDSGDERTDGRQISQAQVPRSTVMSNLPSALRPIPQQPIVTVVPSQQQQIDTNRLSESPIEVSPVVQPSRLAPGRPDHSPNLDVPPSPLSNTSTPELIERPSQEQEPSPYAAADQSRTRARAASNAANSFVPQPSAALQPQSQNHSLYQQQQQQQQDRIQPLHPHQLHQPYNTRAGTPSTSSPTSSDGGAGPTTASNASQPAPFSPAALKIYLDGEGATDVRDLMLLVHDTSDVGAQPLLEMHDVTRGFDPDQKRLQSMSKRLDDLLMEHLRGRRGAPAA